MAFESDVFRRDLLALLDRYSAAFAVPAGSHALLRRQIDLGDALEDRRSFPGHVTTSALILSPTGAEILLIRHRSLGRWLQPGGHYEPPDTLADSALREAVEETGLQNLHIDEWHRATGLPIDIDTHSIPAGPERGEPEHWHHDVRYVLRASPDDALAPDLIEVERALWHPVSDLDRLAPRALANLRSVGIVRPREDLSGDLRRSP
jgi:8-oxo-dGTP pyrophosphatase MutT (NUDIX family)